MNRKVAPDQNQAGQSWHIVRQTCIKQTDAKTNIQQITAQQEATVSTPTATTITAQDTT